MIGEPTPSACACTRVRRQVWEPKERQDIDNFVFCDGGCNRWFHYICARYPDPAHLPDEWKLERQKLICGACQRRGAPIDEATSLLALQSRRAWRLRSHPLSDAIEAHVAGVMKAHGITINGLVIRVVSSKRFKFPAFRAMKARKRACVGSYLAPPEAAAAHADTSRRPAPSVLSPIRSPSSHPPSRRAARASYLASCLGFLPGLLT